MRKVHLTRVTTCPEGGIHAGLMSEHSDPTVPCPWSPRPRAARALAPGPQVQQPQGHDGRAPLSPPLQQPPPRRPRPRHLRGPIAGGPRRPRSSSCSASSSSPSPPCRGGCAGRRPTRTSTSRRWGRSRRTPGAGRRHRPGHRPRHDAHPEPQPRPRGDRRPDRPRRATAGRGRGGPHRVPDPGTDHEPGPPRRRRRRGERDLRKRVDRRQPSGPHPAPPPAQRGDVRPPAERDRPARAQPLGISGPLRTQLVNAGVPGADRIPDIDAQGRLGTARASRGPRTPIG